MIEVYAFATPNSVRVPIMLEELDLPYDLRPVNVRKGEQKLPQHLALNPNGKVPVLVDPDGPRGERLVLTESGAILIYLAEKSGRLLPAEGIDRARGERQRLGFVQSHAGLGAGKTAPGVKPAGIHFARVQVACLQSGKAVRDARPLRHAIEHGTTLRRRSPKVALNVIVYMASRAVSVTRKSDRSIALWAFCKPALAK